MLELRNITKVYHSGDSKVNALAGVSVNFRKNEFVAILGQSGSGKTTLLNIIGGLDRYNTGDMIINGKSTMNYNDSDWDSYRNHSIGFVFQNYNLISHQSVISNVELALTLSGVSKSERRQRAKEVLERVGLGDQLNKKPNQLSGGQMQRVAIARALVNNPDILLADEPTGALDSETSEQIMQLIYEISKDKLVIMVTHNSDIAERYANRIISLKDGRIIDDTSPYSDDECAAENTGPLFDHSKKTKKNGKKTSMDFRTALELSRKNLMTKKGRTFLTSFAGSIGIVGIALILALSNGMQTYIDSIEKDTMSNYPLTIETESVDLGSLLSGLKDTSAKDDDKEAERDPSKLYRLNVIDSASDKVNVTSQKNDLAAFKKFIEDNDEIKELTDDIKFSNDIELQVYKSDTKNGVFQVNPSSIEYTAAESVWTELVGDGELLSAQYQLLAGHWPENENELILFVNEKNEISDYMLYSLGLEDVSGLEALLNDKEDKASDTDKDDNAEPEIYEFTEFLNLGFSVVPNTDVYKKTSDGTWKDESDNTEFMKKAVQNGIHLKVVGIVRPAEGKDGTNPTTSGLGYKSELGNIVAERINSSKIVAEQRKDPSVDIFTGLPFPEVKEEKGTEQVKEESTTAKAQSTFEKPVVSFAEKVETKPTAKYLAESFTMPEGVETMTEEEIYAYIDEHYSDDKKEDMKDMVRLMLKDIRLASDRKKLINYFNESLEGTDSQVTGEDIYSLLNMMDRGSKLQLLTMLLLAANSETPVEIPTEIVTEIVTDEEGKTKVAESKVVVTEGTSQTEPETEPEPEFSDSTYEKNLEILCVTDPERPDSISLYPKNFEAKERIKALIDKYNDEQRANDNEAGVIAYTDYVSFVTSGATKIINVITYILIAFVAISLIVSSIMIGVITRISVLERTKEIGILRSIGASKKDISHVFNSETIIIGFISGVMGILLSLLLIVPINAIVKAAAKIDNLASLPILGIVGLLVVSVLLTFIAGINPSRKAAKQDPVVALRSE